MTILCLLYSLLFCIFSVFFVHILLIPAIKKAGFEPILQKTKGSELIHGEIIRNIESADFILCDTSVLNPDVFFELGIRTSLNKPVCILL